MNFIQKLIFKPVNLNYTKNMFVLLDFDQRGIVYLCLYRKFDFKLLSSGEIKVQIRF